MKTLKNLRNSLFFGFLAVGTLGFLAPTLTLAEGKGASKLMFTSSESPAYAHATTPTLAQMSCVRCTDGYTKVVDKSAKGLRAETMRTVATHKCPSCETKIVSVGTGKAKTDKIAHNCGNSSPTQASCCMAAK